MGRPSRFTEGDVSAPNTPAWAAGRCGHPERELGKGPPPPRLSSVCHSCATEQQPSSSSFHPRAHGNCWSTGDFHAAAYLNHWRVSDLHSSPYGNHRNVSAFCSQGYGNHASAADFHPSAYRNRRRAGDFWSSVHGGHGSAGARRQAPGGGAAVGVAGRGQARLLQPLAVTGAPPSRSGPHPAAAPLLLSGTPRPRWERCGAMPVARK